MVVVKRKQFPLFSKILLLNTNIFNRIIFPTHGFDTSLIPFDIVELQVVIFNHHLCTFYTSFDLITDYYFVIYIPGFFCAFHRFIRRRWSTLRAQTSWMRCLFYEYTNWILSGHSLSRIIDWRIRGRMIPGQDVHDCDRWGNNHSLTASVAAPGSSGKLKTCVNVKTRRRVNE